MVKKNKVVMTAVPGADALDAIQTDEGAQALYEDICQALGIEPASEDEPQEAAAEE